MLRSWCGAVAPLSKNKNAKHAHADGTHTPDAPPGAAEGNPNGAGECDEEEEEEEEELPPLSW